MNKEKLSWGLVLIAAGVIILLNNLNVINFYWRSVFSLWPVVLIIIGVNLLVPRRGAGSYVSIVVTIVALAFLAYRGTFPPRSNWWAFSINGHHDKNDTRVTRHSGDLIEEYFSSPYTDTISLAKLHIKGGAVDYSIRNSTPDKLFEAETQSTLGSYILETNNQNNQEVDLTFKMENTKNKNWNIDVDKNSVEIKLHTNPIWELNMDFGAGAADFDLSPYKIGLLKIKGGAVAVETRLGLPPLPESEVHVESGVASVSISIPKDAACIIHTKTGLSSRSFPGFTKQDNNTYITDGYHNATNRYVIHLKGGLSSFEVDTY